MSNLAKTRLKSSWTPLNHEEANLKIFEERRTLVVKWFEKWTDSQRRVVLGDLVDKCRLKQLEFTGEIVSKRKPIYHEDFTRCLPRVLSLYVLSFLDPRSLCRCSQVCWHWKSLTELDNLWLPKCLRLGWVLPFSPSPYETGTWKHFYIENIVALKCLIPKVPKDMPISELHSLSMTDHGMPSHRGSPRTKSGSKGRPPWRGSDPVPKDTWRNNYLENDDEVEKVTKLRQKGAHGKEAVEMTLRARTKVKAGNSLMKRPSSLPRSQSSQGLGSPYTEPWPRERPDWAKGSGDLELSKTVPGRTSPPATMDATRRPPPVTTVKVTGKQQRTNRDPPSSDLFPSQPWSVPGEEEYDSETY